MKKNPPINLKIKTQNTYPYTYLIIYIPSNYQNGIIYNFIIMERYYNNSPNQFYVYDIFIFIIDMFNNIEQFYLYNVLIFIIKMFNNVKEYNYDE